MVNQKRRKPKKSNLPKTRFMICEDAVAEGGKDFLDHLGYCSRCFNQVHTSFFLDKILKIDDQVELLQLTTAMLAENLSVAEAVRRIQANTEEKMDPKDLRKIANLMEKENISFEEATKKIGKTAPKEGSKEKEKESKEEKNEENKQASLSEDLKKVDDFIGRGAKAIVGFFSKK